jgi:ABC-2 type transport system ATP-binding protein
MTENVIETHGLTRYFGKKAAVQALDLAVPKGCVFGFLGRNGSGKTTTIRVLLGLLEPTRGASSILGHDSQTLTPELRARIGYLAEGHHVYGWMRIRECENFQKAFYEHWNADLFNAVVDHFQLDRRAKAKSLSRGQRAGLCLALTLAPEPELLVLDDPALGLDPVARRALVEAMIYVTRKEGRTVFFSSHLLGDVERVADRIAVLEDGHLRACCSLDKFREQIRRFVLHFDNMPPELPKMPGLLQSRRTEREIALTVANHEKEVEAVIQGLGAKHVEQVEIDLEEAFISYVAKRGRSSSFLQGVGGAA